MYTHLHNGHYQVRPFHKQSQAESPLPPIVTFPDYSAHLKKRRSTTTGVWAYKAASELLPL